MNNDKLCPQCAKGQLKDWQELSDEEQEVVRRLPGSAEHSQQERWASHRWCPICWFEATGNASDA